MERRGPFEMFRLLIATSLLLVLLSVSVRVNAAPPVDLSDFDGGKRTVRRNVRPLEDKDLIFTDNIIKPEKTIRGLIEFKKEAIGRTHPDSKQGKPVLRFRKEYRARFLQFSKDKKWVAVELLNGRKRAWVPQDAVEILDEEYIRNLGGKFPGGQDQ